jgi:hypothetical protein
LISSPRAEVVAIGQQDQRHPAQVALQQRDPAEHLGLRN